MDSWVSSFAAVFAAGALPGVQTVVQAWAARDGPAQAKKSRGDPIEQSIRA